MTTTILLVDNDPEYLDACKMALEREGYEVYSADSHATAQHQLQSQTQIDLMIIDIRLLNDTDTHDISGIELGRMVRDDIPKIMITSHPNVEVVREVLRPQLNRVQLAADFVSKRDGITSLLTSIRRVLPQSLSRFQQINQRISYKIEVDYLDAREQLRGNYLASLVVAVLGVLIVFVGATMALYGLVEIGAVTAGAGLVVDAVSLLFFRRADAANTRMDQYHRELLSLYHLDTLLAACEELQGETTQNERKAAIIENAMQSWFQTTLRSTVREGGLS